MSVITTFNFLGRTEEAINFYREAVGAEVVFLSRFRDWPQQSHVPPDAEDLIFHATFRIDGTEFMASDVGYEENSNPIFAGFSLVLRSGSQDQANRRFSALADGGCIQIPLAKSEFADGYGIVIDRFGVSWKVVVASGDG